MTRTSRLGSTRWSRPSSHERVHQNVRRPATPRGSCRRGRHYVHRRCRQSRGSGASTTKSIPGAFGALTNIQWSSSSVYEAHFTFLVRDTAADGDHAEARVQTIDPDGQITSFRWHSAIGYGDETRFATYARTSSAISAIRIQVCRKGDDLRDICDPSPWVIS